MVIFFFLIERMLYLRGLDTVRITKVKGHAGEGMVLDGRVREVDRLGDDAADEAADFGWRRVGPAVIDARRDLSGVGAVPDPLVWSAGTRPKRRRLFHAVRDRAFLLGPPGTWDSEWVTVPASAIFADDIAHWPHTPCLLVKWVAFLGTLHWFTLFGIGHCCLGHLVLGILSWFQIPAAVVCAEDIALWPYTPGLLVKWVSFFGSLHWPIGGLDLVVGGISHVELLILYELWAGERLSLEKAQPRYLRPERPILVSAVPFGPGIDIWRSCRFIGTLMRSLCMLPGVGLFLALLVLIIASFVILAGKIVVMVLLLGLVRAPLSLF